MPRRSLLTACLLLLGIVTPGAHPVAAGAATTAHFESPPVHPLEISEDGRRLFAAHTADHRLVVFNADADVPVRIAEIPVGLEPVTVRARTATEVWVVNHVSDSISVVDLTSMRVVRTLLVGDEPTDVVFAGTPERAFVCLSQEDRLLVLDPLVPSDPGISIPLEGSDPRSLAVSPDGSLVYVTIHDSGNETTVIGFQTVDQLGGPPPPDPPLAPGLPAPPRTGLVVRHDGSTWRDEAGGDWSAAVGYTLLDHDVIAIDANSLTVARTWSGVGTTLFNVAVNPATGDLVVTNQEAHNEIRFEPKLRGRFADQRVSLLSSSGGVVVRDLNPHVDRGVPGDPLTRASSASMPLDVVVAADGGAIYVAAFGSAKVLALDASGQVQRRIAVGGGPAGLALDPERDRLFVLERFASDLAWIDLATDGIGRTSLGFDPTPSDVREGRRVFYDGENSSEYGDLSCASCHLFGRMDNLAWDLGDPQGEMQPVPPGPANPLGNLPPFHPMKGPMTTQTLQGIAGTEPLHWRGDRNVLADFNGAFVSLMGRDAPLSGGDFALFEAFVNSLRFPSNPHRQLDGSLPADVHGGDPTAGQQLYLTGNLVGNLQCVNCHTLPTGENGLIIPGPALLEDEAKVVPQLRNLYEKTRFDDQASTNVRGFGFTHDGAVDDLFTFLEFRLFTFPDDQARRDVVAFLLAFETGTPPAVGAQWTADGSSDPDGSQRLTALQAQADVGRIDLVAKGGGDDGPRGWSYDGGGLWTSDRASEPALGTASLLALAGPGTELTFTGVLAGEGTRLGIDRDEDGALDRDEIDAGSDPGDPASLPGSGPTGVAGDPRLTGVELRIDGALPARGPTRLALRAPAGTDARLDVFDVRGRRVRTLFAGALAEERHQMQWDLRDDDGRAVAAGVYLVRFATEQRTIARRMVVLR